jgi:transcription factor S
MFPPIPFYPHLIYIKVFGNEDNLVFNMIFRKKTTKKIVKRRAVKKTVSKRKTQPRVSSKKSISSGGIDFCGKCGSIMLPEKGRTATKLKCRSCGSILRKSVKKVKITEKANHKSNVIVLEQDVSSLPITNALCERCGNKKAYWWMQQTKGDDEPPTQFLKCTACKKVWREYR